MAQAAAPSKTSTTVGAVVVTASRVNLLGVAATASQGTITAKEVELRPAFRVGQLFETVPGLVVTVHSGEGKANQYLLRGFNLDHGTDFASFIDGMPVNRPTNTHGQGYSDQNFLMPQLVSGVDFTKGPFYAGIGDFGAVGSAHVRITDDLTNQVSVSVGTLRDQDVFVGGTHHFGDDDRLLAAVDLSHLDGPWSPPSKFNKVNLAARYSHGSDADGFSLTGMYYNSAGGLETDQPQRAVEDGLISKYGSLDPTDRSRSERYSISGQFGAGGDHWRLASNAYVIHSTMTLWNNFTHYLDDPVNGDQEQQDETRDTFGGAASLTMKAAFGAVTSDTTLGVQNRYDSAFVDRRHTLARQTLDYCELEAASLAGTGFQAAPLGTPAGNLDVAYSAVGGACNADRVKLNDLGVYAENTTRWTGWLRTVVGLREESYWANDKSLTIAFSGSRSQSLLQPKVSLILGPWEKTEIYLSAGRGFHSDDARGVLGGVPSVGISGVATPLLAAAISEEFGVRTNIIPRVQVQLAAFQIDFDSELKYNSAAGQDEATAPSRRQGVEISGQYRPFSWIELNTDLAFSQSRYRPSDATLLSVYGLPGHSVADAPSFIGSFGVLVDNLGPWFGGLQWRCLGPHALIEDNSVRDAGYSAWNADIGYKVNPKLKVQLSIYNLLNSKQEAAGFYYTARLPGEPGDGVAGMQVHPMEPISARLAITANF